MRWLALVAGIALSALAVAAVTRVTDTREGLIAEVITLLGGLAGITLLIYGLAARPRRGVSAAAGPPSAPTPTRTRSGNDLKLGGGGIALALLLLVGLAISGGWLWATLGTVLLLPMLSGCVYLCVRYLRANP